MSTELHTDEAVVVHVITPAGRIHKAVRLGGQLASYESCNLDDAHGEVREREDISDASPIQLCDRCFPHSDT